LSIQKKIAKNTLYNFVVKAIALAFAFIASVVVARFLGPEKYGVYSLVIWFLTMVGLLVNLGIPTTMTKYVSEYWGRKNFSAIGSILSKLLRFELIAAVLVSLALFILAPLIAEWYDNPELSLYLRVAALVILPLGLMFLYNGLFSGLQRFDLIARANAIAFPITLAVILLIVYMQGRIEWLVSVSILTNLLLVCCYLYFKKTKFSFIRKGSEAVDFSGRLFRFSASVFVVVVLDALVWERFGIFFLSIFSTSSEIAFYNVAFILANRPMVLLPGALTGILLPAMSEVYGTGDRAELARVHSNSTRYLAMLSFPLCLGGIAIAQQLLPTLYGASYQPASLIFSILILGATVGSIATSSSSLLYSAELQKIVVRVGILAAFVIIVASWLLVPLLGAMGAALAGALAQLVGGVTMIAYAYKSYMKQKFPGPALFRTFSAAALMATAAFVISETVEGWVGVIMALIISPLLYIFCLFLTRSLSSEDIELAKAAIGRLPESWAKVVQPLFTRLVKTFYPDP
jgi:O-antigen/teichoic acid export membrane protein